MISDPPSACRVLGGCRILVVENFAPLAAFLAKALHCAGADVVGPVATLDAARKLAGANTGIAAALLDVHLYDGEAVWPLAQMLASRNLPFVFYTHLDAGALPAEWADRPVVTKPSSIENILGTLVDAMSPERVAAPVDRSCAGQCTN